MARYKKKELASVVDEQSSNDDGDQYAKFLTKVSKLLVRVLIPKSYLAISPFNHLLVEVITNSVLFRTIDLLSDPDYLNLKIIEVIKSTQEESNKNQSKTKYAFAETYDEFIDLIKKTNSLDELKRIRYFIVTEIMQATAINNLKRERSHLNQSGQGSVKKSSSVKGDHLLSRNLPRYINQLRFVQFPNHGHNLLIMITIY